MRRETTRRRRKEKSEEGHEYPEKEEKTDGGRKQFGRKQLPDVESERGRTEG